MPRTSHLLLHEKPELCTRLVTDFLTGDPAPTLVASFVPSANTQQPLNPWSAHAWATSAALGRPSPLS